MQENAMTSRIRTLSDRQINENTDFLAYVPPEDNDGTAALPCLVLAGDENADGGVQVYAYAENGQLVISVHYDTAGPDENGDGPWAYYGPHNAIPTVLLTGDATPAWQATAEVNPDARPHAPATPEALRSWIGTLASPPRRRSAGNAPARGPGHTAASALAEAAREAQALNEPVEITEDSK